MGITERIDNTTRISDAYRKEVCPPPTSVKVELTASCNLKCTFCATPMSLREKGHMDFNLFKSLAQEIRDLGIEELGLFYLGESLLYPHIVEAVEFAKREVGFPYVFLTTNGVLANRGLVARLFYAGLDSLKFSLNWGSGEQMREITKVDAFDRVVKNIQAARTERDTVWDQTGHKCGLYASSIKYDGEQGRRMEAVLDRLRPYLDEHYYLPLFDQHTLVEGNLSERGLQAIGGNVGRVDGEVNPVPCWALFKAGHVTFDGVLTGCCFSHTPEFDFGDLKETPFMQAWNSSEARAFRRAHLSGDVRGTPCEGCVKYA